MSDNKLVEGFDSVNLDGDEEVLFFFAEIVLIRNFRCVVGCWHRQQWFYRKFLWWIFEERLCSLQS